jgi:acyl-[acyl-carrier-protein]-phospholipid O-acyltransferase/long-chain-fatty-acid--[acyl-carrier-protein] ligase
MLHAIPVGGGREGLAAIDEARKQLEAGHVVCIFAEGAISRTGNLLPFKRGLERIVAGLDVPIVPVYLDRVWGSVFSFERGKFLWKLPKRLPYPVTVAFGDRLPSATPAADVRIALMTVGARATAMRRGDRDVLGRAFIASAKRHWGSFCMADSSSAPLTYGRALTASLLLSRWVRRHAGTAEHVGVLLPASVGGALANVAVSMSGRVPVNLNFTAGRDGMDAAIARCGITTVLTSRRFLEKAEIAPSVQRAGVSGRRPRVDLERREGAHARRRAGAARPGCCRGGCARRPDRIPSRPLCFRAAAPASRRV